MAMKKLMPDVVDIRLSCGISLTVDLKEKFWRQIATHGTHERDLEKFLISVLKPGNIVLDIGAHVGIYTVIAAKLVKDKGYVYSFEPDPHNFESLQRSVFINKFKNVSTVRLALGDEDRDRVTFYRSDDFYGSLQIIDTVYGEKEKLKQVESYEMCMRTLDSFLMETGISHVDVVKIDVDGPELMVLLGTRELLGSNTPPMLVVEVSRYIYDWGYGYEDLHNFLTNFGYQIYGTTRKSLNVRRIYSPEDFEFDIYEKGGAVNLYCVVPEVHGESLQNLWFFTASKKNEDVSGKNCSTEYTMIL